MTDQTPTPQPDDAAVSVIRSCLVGHHARTADELARHILTRLSAAGYPVSPTDTITPAEAADIFVREFTAWVTIYPQMRGFYDNFLARLEKPNAK